MYILLGIVIAVWIIAGFLGYIILATDWPDKDIINTRKRLLISLLIPGAYLYIKISSEIKKIWRILG